MTIVGYAQESYEDYLKRYSWLLNEINGQTAEIINTSDADFIWKGRPTVTYTKVNSIYSEITINCEVHPYKLKKQDTIVEKTVSEEMCIRDSSLTVGGYPLVLISSFM